jgi:hypothetical protein
MTTSLRFELRNKKPPKGGFLFGAFLFTTQVVAVNQQ